MEAMIILAAFIIVLSAVMLIISLVKHLRAEFYIGCTLCIGWGSAILVFALLDMYEPSIAAFLMGSGILAIAVGAFGIRLSYRCNMTVTAVFLGADVRIKGGTEYYTPTFDYTVGGERYIRPTTQSYSKKDVRHLIEGDSVTVFIDPKDPGTCIMTRRVRWENIFAVLLGAVVIIVAILSLTTRAVEFCIHL